MSRFSSAWRLIGLMLLGVLGAPDLSLRAQEGANVDPSIAPTQRVDRSRLTHPDLRAGSVDAGSGEPADPRVDSLLEEWARQTKKIKKLQGQHWRATRDFSWGTESWAQGQFYVETPDKGRIDVEPLSSKANMPKTVKCRDAKGQSVELKRQRDTKRDRWICDGREIKAIDDDNKTYEVVKIPPSQRGDNIMDGPLPFLFGMPPEKARARYRFKILAEDDKAYAIEVRPNWKQDAVDWIRAELVLDKSTCLPSRVHLHNAAGTGETVYYFRNLQVNKINLIFWTDPFEPSLTFYKRSVHNSPQTPGSDFDPIQANKMPSLIGLHYKSVKAKMESLGFTVTVLRGDPATAIEQVYHVEKQEPLPNSPLDRKSPIILTLYDVMPDRTAAKPPTP
jgi:TIGR03009 family protein